jgi:hypothetical protein
MLEAMTQNPCRVPNWRWLRAQDIAQGGPPATMRRDGATSTILIRRAARFYKALQNYDSDERQMKLAWERPDMFWAHYMYDQLHNPMRWSIEARILAGESNQEIARRIGCAEEIIQIYEGLFFNVRDKLNRKDYILHTVLKDAVLRGLQEREKDLLWKLVAYTGGSYMLDAVINPLVTPHWVTNPDDIPAFLQESAINVIKKKATIAALCVPINSQTEIKLIKALSKFVKIESSMDSQGKATDQINQGIGAMLESLTFRGGSRKAAKAQAGPLPEYDRGAVELRHDELTVVAAGYSLPGDKLLKQFKFPEQIAPVSCSAKLIPVDMLQNY